MDSNCCSEPASYAAVEEDGTSGLVIEVFHDLDKIGADVVLLHDRPQSCIPNAVKGLLKVYEHIVEVLLVLEIVKSWVLLVSTLVTWVQLLWHEIGMIPQFWGVATVRS